MKISIEQILSWKPCVYYNTREKIIAKTDNYWPKTPLEIANLDIYFNDRFWVLFRSDVIDERSLHLLACDFAEHVLPVYETQYPDDNIPRKTIETKRLWVRGEATDAELRKVYGNICDIAEAAYKIANTNVTADAVYYATKAVFYAADAVFFMTNTVASAIAHGAASAAALATRSNYSTERTWQLERIKEVLKEIEK